MSTELAVRSEGMGKSPTLPYKTALLVIVFLALAASHALEVLIKIFRRFQSYRGVYFYSLIAASVGIIIHALGYFIRNYGISGSAPLEITMACGGGMLMITGQSIVLWSRLHLVSPGKRDRWLLYMIIADCVIVQGGATALFAGSNSTSPGPWLKIYAKWEIFQVTWFVFQECVISGLYIYRTFVLMRSAAIFRGPDAKRLFNHLVLVNVVIIALDVTILAFQYAGLYEIQTSWKTLAYAIKLKLEFDILNRLVDFTKQGFKAPSGSRHLSGTGGERATTRTDEEINVRGSRFGSPTYARMEEDCLVELAMKNVVKTTEFQVSVDQDAISQSSTRELRERNNILD
ncbi:integral membrane protein [Stemphylium lycopersici]|nr:integral membrane protein [Stemphylium lycopersici]RAR08779.1 integral membrane protein [Stemphylium lycopersici]